MPLLDPASCDCRLVWANEREVEPRFLRARLRAADITVGWLLLAGSVRVSVGGSVQRVRAGQWFFPMRADGEQRFTPGARILSVRFALRNRAGPEILTRDRHLVFPAARHPELEARARELALRLAPWARRGSLTIVRHQIPLDANLEIDAAFSRWLAVYLKALLQEGMALRLNPPDDPRVRKALALIAAHPLARRFRVSDLARACGLGVNRLGALFQQATGKSPLAHYEALRLEHARHLLADSDHRIKEIAWALGFGTPQHFSNWFKARQGRSPRSFAEQGADG